jgi:predicted O-methyltransferase YrrM
MAITYTASPSIIEATLQKLREDGGIAPEARFDGASFPQLRQVVLPRDLDFLHMAEQRPLGTIGPRADDGWVPDQQRVALALGRLKRNGFVAADAVFDDRDPHRLAETVRYRDMHFLFYLGQYGEVEIAAEALALLKSQGLVAAEADDAPSAFAALRREVRACFVVPDTAISPAMERLLYLLAALKRPQHLLGMGIFCANAFIWSAGAAYTGGKADDAARICGVDIDAQAITLARSNLARLSHTANITLLAEDGRLTAERLAGPFDYVYLDIGSAAEDKRINLQVLQTLYPKLSPGAWVLAHDTTLPAFREAFASYLRFVRDPRYFAESISFDIDCLGLELSIMAR